METLRRKPLDENLTARFILPVIFENLLIQLIGIFFYRSVSTISTTALTAAGMANNIMTVVSAVFSIVTVGTAVLVARQVGAGDGAGAEETVEQSILLTLLSGTAVTAVCLLTAVPLLRLLMPGAEEQLFHEAVVIFRLQIVSTLGMVLQAMLGSILRAMGDSRHPMLSGVLMNVSQLLFGFLFISVFHWGAVGAGLCYVACRLVGTAIIFTALCKDRRYFTLRLRGIFCRPHWPTFRRIFHLGGPVSVESIFIQAGYVVGNSMAISLGTFRSGVYQIMNTMNAFITLPQTVCSAIAMTSVGHLLGGGRRQDARKAGTFVWAAGIASVAVLGTLTILLVRPFSGLYTQDSAAVDECARWVWLLLVMDIAGVSINAVDPQLRAGGDVRFVMTESLSGVWLLRLPLTWLFCLHWDFGVPGIFLANTISLYGRAIAGLLRRRGEKWIHHI